MSDSNAAFKFPSPPPVQHLWRAATFVAQELSPQSILERRIDGRKIHMRPLAPIVPYPTEPQALSLQSLEQWTHSEQYKKAHVFFEHYPEHCLTFPFERSLLYHIIRSRRPQHVVEIGTYFAGSSEVMARALWENGTGTLHTADPLSFHRVGRIMRRWPRALRAHAKYYPVTSQGFFHLFRKRGLMADLVFIDGNHDFEYAYFDLLSAARMTRPGGIIIIDDMDQPGPYWAAVEFLKQHPGWREIGNAVASFSPGSPFAVSKGLMGSKFIVLQSVEHIVLGELPYTTGQVPYHHTDVGSIRVALAPNAPKGTLHGKIYLRSSSKGVLPEQLTGYCEGEVSGQPQLDMPLDDCLRSAFAQTMTPEEYNQKIEIILYWQPQSAGHALKLTAAPEAKPPA